MTKRNQNWKIVVFFGLWLPLLGCQGAISCPTQTIQGPADLAAASRCTVVDGDLRILGSGLSSLAELRHISRAGYVVISGNPELESLAGLSALRAADGLTIQYNASLTSLRGLEQLESLDGLVVLANDSLTTLDGLQNLKEAADVVVADNPRLVSAAALASLPPGHREIQSMTSVLAGRE